MKEEQIPMMSQDMTRLPDDDDDDDDIMGRLMA